MDLNGWKIAVVGSLSLVGKLVFPERIDYGPMGDGVGFPKSRKLSPVYVMSVTASQAGRNMQIHRTVFPMLLYHTITEVELPTDAILVDVMTVLSEKERQELEKRVESAEEMRRALRAAEGGIHVAQAMPE